MFWFDTTMVCSHDPGLQVAEDEMDHGQVRLCLVRVAIERQRLMAASYLGKSLVADPPIGSDGSAQRDVLFDKIRERFGTPIWHDTQPQASCVDATLVRLAVMLTQSNLDGTDHGSFMVRAPTLSARLAANIAFIDFDRVLAADGVAFVSHHASAELVEDLKGRLIAGERELALELDGGLTRSLRSHEVRAPKPRREGGMARLHDSACGERGVSFAATAAQYHRRAGRKAIGVTDESALRTCKTVWPADGLKVAGACAVIGEYSLKFGQRRWKAAWIHARKDSSS